MKLYGIQQQNRAGYRRGKRHRTRDLAHARKTRSRSCAVRHKRGGSSRGRGQGEKAKASKVLEINPNHEIFKTLNEIKADKELVNKYSSVLYNEAMLLEGFDVENKSEFIKNLNDIVIASLKK